MIANIRPAYHLLSTYKIGYRRVNSIRRYRHHELLNLQYNIDIGETAHISSEYGISFSRSQRMATRDSLLPMSKYARLSAFRIKSIPTHARCNKILDDII